MDLPAAYLDYVTEWDMTEWSGIPVRKYYKVAIGAHYPNVSISHAMSMTVNVVRMENANK